MAMLGHDRDFGGVLGGAEDSDSLQLDRQHSPAVACRTDAVHRGASLGQLLVDGQTAPSGELLGPTIACHYFDEHMSESLGEPIQFGSTRCICGLMALGMRALFDEAQRK